MTRKQTFRTMLGATVLLGGVALAGPAHALVIGFDPGTPFTTAGLSGFSTDGDDMATGAGISVTAFFTAGGSQTLSWGIDVIGTSAGVLGTGWSLAEDDDTFGGIWTLASSVGLSGFSISGSPGNTVFDVALNSDGTQAGSGIDDGSNFGSAGSARGWTFEVVSGVSALTATYSNAVQIGASAPVGDLWETLTVGFDSSFTGTMEFITDTDQADSAGDVNPVPEPGPLALLGLGLIGVVVSRRRKA